MDLGLKGKVAVVAGASRGIGLGIAHRLAAEGCNLAICARDAEQLARAAEELESESVAVLAVPMDLTAPGEAERLIAEAEARFGGVDVLVGNLGGNRRKPFEATTDADWEDILDLNLRAHIRCSRAAIPRMKQAGGGSIIFITSIFGREAGGTGLSIYNTTKSALISLSKIMALELAPHGIRVNNVAPGSIRFPGGSWDRRCISDPEGMAVFIEQNLPLGRFGTVQEVGNVVAFLASDCASLVTGTSINVDGGQSHSLI